MENIDRLIDQIERELASRVPSVPRQTAEVLKIVAFLISSNRDKPVFVETGTGYGYSTAWLLKGMLDAGKRGVIYTIEIDRERSLKTKEIFANYGLDGYVNFLIGDASEVLKEIEAPIDLIFLDNSKDKYYYHTTLLYDKLSKGGVILAHNVLDFRHLMRDFIKEIENEDRWITTIFENDPAGLSISIKK